MKNMRKVILSFLMCAALTASAQDRSGTPEQMAEKVFGFVVNNQTDSLYLYHTRQMKLILTKEKLDGILKSKEEVAGKYKSHGPWTVKELSGSKTCTATVEFEKSKLGALIILDPSNFVIGVQIVPAEAIK